MLNDISYELRNKYENELIDIMVEFKGYPKSQTKKKSMRLKYLIHALGIKGFFN